MTTKKNLLNWLAQNDLKRVFEKLHLLADQHKDEQLRNIIALQSSRLNNLEKQRIEGILSFDNYQLQATKIREALVQIIDRLPDNWEQKRIEDNPYSIRTTPKHNFKKYIFYIILAITILIGFGLIIINRVNIEGDGNTFIKGNGNKINNFFGGFFDKKQDKLNSIIGDWETIESWHKFISTIHIKSTISFSEPDYFKSDVTFIIEGMEYSGFEYHGNWEIVESNLVFENIKVTNSKFNKVYEDTWLESGHKYTAVKIFQSYLNHPNGYKIEDLKVQGYKLLKTQYQRENKIIEKIYRRK